MTRVRVGFTVLILAAFLAAGAQVSFALPDPAADTAAGTTGAAAGTTGAQTSTSCPTPRLGGLPKSPKLTNSTIHFTLTNLTPGSSFIVRAGDVDVFGSFATESTFKNKFLLPDQGTHSRKIDIAAIIDGNCDNAPWKVVKRIRYKAVTTPTPARAAPATPPAPQAVAPTPVKPAKPLPTRAPVKPSKLAKPITQQLPSTGLPPSRRAWLTPNDSGARLDQRLTAPQLARLERKSDKAQSTNALFGLGIVAALLGIAGVGGFLAFRRRDDVQFERAMTEQLKHLEEGDPVQAMGEDPSGPLATAEQAPFADPEPITAELPADPIQTNGVTADPVDTNGVPAEPAHTNSLPAAHRARVESDLERLLNEAGLEAELEGILADARLEAERNGITLDPELMLEALCEETDGMARLSDPKRAELRSLFAEIIAEETQQTPAEGEKVPTP